MRLVHHHEGIVFLRQFADLVHRSHVSVHGEHSVSGDNPEPLGLSLLQTTLEIGHISIGITVSLRLAEPYAVDDGRMVQCIGNDGIFLSQKRFEDSSVGIEASGIEDGVFSMEILADRLFQLLVDVLCSADETY